MIILEVEEYTEYSQTLDILRGAIRRLRRRNMRSRSMREPTGTNGPTRSTNENSSREGYGLSLNK